MTTFRFGKYTGRDVASVFRDDPAYCRTVVKFAWARRLYPTVVQAIHDEDAKGFGRGVAVQANAPRKERWR